MQPGPVPLPRPLPALRLPVGRRPREARAGAIVSVALHVGVIALLVLRESALIGAGSGAASRRAGGGGGGGGGGRPQVNFFVLPPAAPAAVEVLSVPPVAVADLPALRHIPLDLPPVNLPAAFPAPTAAAVAGQPATGPGGAGAGGAGGGQGTGVGPGTGPDSGSGTASGPGYIFASPRTAITPPLASVPGSVAGRTYRVRFWVSAEGRVTRIEVEPPIADGNYSREFQQRMMAYQFYPAHTRDGRNIASTVTVSIHLGN